MLSGHQSRQPIAWHKHGLLAGSQMTTVWKCISAPCPDSFKVPQSAEVVDTFSCRQVPGVCLQLGAVWKVSATPHVAARIAPRPILFLPCEQVLHVWRHLSQDS